MKELDLLRSFNQEMNSINFSYENILRTMHLIHQTKDILKSNAPIPNKEIALHQINKTINEKINIVIYCNTENEIKEAYDELRKSFLVSLNYFIQ